MFVHFDLDLTVAGMKADKESDTVTMSHAQ